MLAPPFALAVTINTMIHSDSNNPTITSTPFETPPLNGSQMYLDLEAPPGPDITPDIFAKMKQANIHQLNLYNPSCHVISSLRYGDKFNFQPHNTSVSTVCGGGARFGPDGKNYSTYVQDIVNLAHEHGLRACLTLGGEGVVADAYSVSSEGFDDAESLSAVLKKFTFDCVDLFMHNSPSIDQGNANTPKQWGALLARTLGNLQLQRNSVIKILNKQY